MALSVGGWLVLACSGGPDSAGPLDPSGGGGQNQGGGEANYDEPVVELGLRLTVCDSSSPTTALAVARDGDSTDSLNLYLDVEITNLGPEVVYLPDEAKT